MSRFRVIPLSTAVAERIRTTRQDDFDNKVLEQVATGYGPCRVSLTTFRPGHDRRLLFSYSPFAEEGLYSERGPLFIHAEAVEPYQDIHRFPPEIKCDPVHFPLSLLGYSADHRMNFARLVGQNDVDEFLVEVLNQHYEVAYLHVRNAEACCYICTIERA